MSKELEAANRITVSPKQIPDNLWRAAMSTYHREIRRNPGNAWQAVCAEVLRLGGCARDQGTTQYCAEAAAMAAENERLRAALEMFACDCAVHERCALPDNCRNFQARRAALKEPRT